jgi:hypothetical protein
MENLTHLADLIRNRNEIDREISALIGRPANRGHLGEYIASHIFDIDLYASASTRAADGRFRSGPLFGCSVNIKFYGKFERGADLVASAEAVDHPDYYLILAGPVPTSMSSKGSHAPTVIDSVYLLHASTLLNDLRSLPRMVKLGIATSIRKQFWSPAMLFPIQVNQTLILTPEQRTALALFAPAS